MTKAIICRPEIQPFGDNTDHGYMETNLDELMIPDIPLIIYGLHRYGLPAWEKLENEQHNFPGTAALLSYTYIGSA